MSCCSSASRLLHSALPAFGLRDLVLDHRTGCILADRARNRARVADRGHAHPHRLGKAPVLLRMSDGHFLAPVFGKGQIPVLATDPRFGSPPASPVPLHAAGLILLAPGAQERLVPSPVGDTELGSAIYRVPGRHCPVSRALSRVLRARPSFTAPTPPPGVPGNLLPLLTPQEVTARGPPGAARGSLRAPREARPWRP